MFIDTHSHIYAEEFDNDREEVIQRAWEADVHQIILRTSITQPDNPCYHSQKPART